MIILCMLLCIPLLAENIYTFDHKKDGLIAVQTMAESGATEAEVRSGTNVLVGQSHVKDYILWFKVNKTLEIIPKN